MYIEAIKKELLSCPEVQAFSEMTQVISGINDRDGTCWDYVFAACEAVGGTRADALPAAIGNFCMLTSIHLVDDMIDDDPKGDYHIYGIGTTANMAIAFQSLGLRVVDRSPLNASTRSEIISCLTEMMLKTSIAQQNELRASVGNEKDYWDKISAKTPPLFSAALFTGALSGGAHPSTAQQLSSLGMIYGKLVQVSDDLSDVYSDHCGPDWRTPHNNLALLYCLEADYELKTRFKELLQNMGEGRHLAEAQDIITSSGALSYCVYHLLALYKQLRLAIEEMELPFKTKLLLIGDSLVNPVRKLLAVAGASNPDLYWEKDVRVFG